MRTLLFLKRSRKLASLSFLEKKFFFEACFTLVFYKLITFSNFITTKAFQKKVKPLSCKNQLERVSAKLIETSIQQATKALPFHCSCLVLALTARKMLDKRNLHFEFKWGWIKSSKNQIKAHAWIVVEGRSFFNEDNRKYHTLNYLPKARN
jgi:hypothetical protein